MADKKIENVEDEFEFVFYVVCPDCDHKFRPIYCEYNKDSGGQERTIVISSCLSSGVYSVELQCPKCHKAEDIMKY